MAVARRLSDGKQQKQHGILPVGTSITYAHKEYSKCAPRPQPQRRDRNRQVDTKAGASAADPARIANDARLAAKITNDAEPKKVASPPAPASAEKQ